MRCRSQPTQTHGCGQVFWLCLCGLLLSAPAALARVNVVTLPGRDTVQLTIYNSADLTLVKETRVLTFRKGLNRLEFSWANTLIDPTSVEFRVLSHADAVDVIDVSFPPRVANTLEWHIQSEYAGEVPVEIRYFTSGITWTADYRFTNSEPSKLGREPLPDGEVKAFRVVTDDNLYAFVGRTAVKYIPVNESLEMELGYDREVLVKPTMMNWEKTNIQFDDHGDVKGWTVKETWQIEVQNSKDIEVVLDVRRNFTGDWSMKTDTNYEKVDANKVKFVLPLKAREKRQFSYDLNTNFGSNVSR